MNFLIKSVSHEDAFEYSTVHTSAWKAAYKNIVPDDYLDNLSIEKNAERLINNLKQLKDYFYMKAVLNEKIIGVLIFGKCQSELVKDKTTGEICAIYLSEEYWGQGYGSQMINFAKTAFKKMGYSEIVLWVLEGNKRARNFYEKCGFVLDDVKKEIILGVPLIEVRYSFTFT